MKKQGELPESGRRRSPGRRLLAGLLSLVMVLTLIPATASAESTTKTALTLHTGTSTSTQFVTIGQEVSLPLPTRAGYVFDGWYRDEACTTNGPMMKILIEAQTDLYAKWVQEGEPITTYTLSFDTNGGDALEAYAATYGVTVDLGNYTPTREGYIFTEWFADEALTERITSVMMTQDTAVYAGWISLEDGEASYQQQAGGDWIVDTFAKACANVYDGGTIKLLKDVEIATPITFRKTVTITSEDSAQGPYTLKRASDFTEINTDATLLNIYYKGTWGTDTYDDSVTLYLDHVYVDGGSKDGISTTDALVTVSYANLVLGEDASIQNNNSPGGYAGGIYSFGGNITVGEGSQIVNCESSVGGGIFADGGTVKITGGKIEGNTTTTDTRTDYIIKMNEQQCGAGIFAWSREDLPDVVIEFESGSISNNTAGNYGAGVYLKANVDKTVTLNMTGGVIEGNTAKHGAGVYVLSGDLVMSGGSITGNTATVYGGGVYYAPLDEHVVYLSGSPKVTGNTSNGIADNIYLDSLYNDSDLTRSIVVTDAFNEDAIIGVTRWKTPTEDEPVKVVAEPSADPAYTITASDLASFTSDDLTYTLQLQGGNIVMTTAVRAIGLTISPTELTMKVGDTAPLTATVTPEETSNKAVIWTSSDETIAAVDQNGVVTAKAVGSATITATTVDGGHTATCQVMVQPADTGPVTLAVEIPVDVTIEQGGQEAPPEEVFTFVLLNADQEELTAVLAGELTAAGAAITTNGVNTYSGAITLTMTEAAAAELAAGFFVAEASGTADGWTYDGTLWKVDLVIDADSGAAAVKSIAKVGGSSAAYDRVSFTNIYTKNSFHPGGNTTYYTLRYESNGGTEYADETYARSTVVPLTKTPAREGYTFTGWYADSSLQERITSITMTSDQTVYAGWERDGADSPGTGVSKWLNCDEHMKYLSGYPNSQFGPDNNMTRAEAAQMFYNLLLNKDVVSTVSFDDVDDQAWYAAAVDTLASIGIIQGVGDNRFAPARSITRAEFTAMAMRFAQLDTAGDNPFSDVSSSAWYYGDVVGAAQYGWITGYPDGTFRPNSTITRAEVTAIVNRMLGRSGDESYIHSHADELAHFADLAESHWAYYHIMEAANSHDYMKTNGVEHWK